MEPLKISNIDVNNIVYTKIKKNQDYKIILVKYKNNNQLNNFVFQTQKILNLNSVYNYDYELLLSLNENSNGVQEFSNFIKKLEEKIKLDVQNNMSWFNNKNDDIIFQKLVRDNNSIKIKMVNNNDLKTQFKLNNNNVDNLKLNNSCYCKLILECYGIWINSKNNFGIYLRPIVVAFNKENTQYDYDFISDNETSSLNNEELDIVDSYNNSSLYNNEEHEKKHPEENNNNLFINSILSDLNNSDSS
jgi:hypothetical protein